MKKTALFAALLCLAQSSLHAVVPSLISYQGHVTDATGNIGESAPVNRTITFRIWNSATAIADANRLYAEKMVVTINKGDFSVLLGQGTSTGETMTYANLDGTGLFNGNDVYLGITVDDGNSGTVDAEITPRQRIVSSAFAMRSRVAESVDGQAITNGMLANNAVDTTQIAGNAVTAAKIAASAVTTTQIADGSVTTAKILDSNVTTGKLADNAVTTAKISDGTIATVDIGAGVVTGAKIGTDTIGASNINADAVGTSEIATDAVGASEIAADSVGASEIAADAVGASEIAANAVGTSEIADGTVTVTDLNFKPATGDENLRMIRGTVAANGTTINAGSGFTPTKLSATGTYRVTFTTPFSGIPSVTASGSNAVQHYVIATLYNVTSSGFDVGIMMNGPWSDGSGYSFIAIGPR